MFQTVADNNFSVRFCNSCDRHKDCFINTRCPKRLCTEIQTRAFCILLWDICRARRKWEIKTNFSRIFHQWSKILEYTPTNLSGSSDGTKKYIMYVFVIWDTTQLKYLSDSGIKRWKYSPGETVTSVVSSWSWLNIMSKQRKTITLGSGSKKIKAPN